MRHHDACDDPDIRPDRSLVLLSVAHAVNHAFAVLLPLIFLAIIDEFGVGVGTVAFLAAVGAFASGAVQLSYAELTRRVSRRRLLGVGGLLFGGGFAAQALATGFATFAIPNIVGADRWVAAASGRQRPPGRAVPARAARLRDQRPHRRRERRHGRRRRRSASRYRAHRLARRVGRVRARGRSPIALLILSSSASAAPIARRRSPAARPRDALRRVLADRDLRWLFLTSVLGGGGRGLGVVNLFALIYLTLSSASTSDGRA